MLWLRVITRKTDSLWPLPQDFRSQNDRDQSSTNSRTFAEHLDVDIYPHGQLNHLLRQFRESYQMSGLRGVRKAISHKLLDFIVTCLFLAPAIYASSIIVLALLIKILTYFDLARYVPIECKGAEQVRSLLDLPTSWWTLTSVVLAILVMSYFALLFRSRLCTIKLFFVGADEPMPPSNHRGAQTYTIALRLLGPNLIMRARKYLSVSDRHVSWDAMHRGRAATTKLPISNRDKLQFDQDISPIARLGLWLMLPKSSDERNRPNAKSIFSQAPRSLYFVYKFSLPQLRLYMLLVLLGVTLPIAKPFGALEKAQYPLILGAMAFVWGLWAIQKYRKELSTLTQWQSWWATKPFGSSPAFLLAMGLQGQNKWIEIAHENFGARIAEYGIETEKLLHIHLGILLVGFLGFMELVK